MSDSTVTISAEVVEATQKAIAFLVNENAELRAELSWFRENPDEPVEPLVDEPIPYEVADPEVVLVREPRVFSCGDVIPADVTALKLATPNISYGNMGDDVVVRHTPESDEVPGFGWPGGGIWGDDDTSSGAWIDEDFPLTEILDYASPEPPVTHTLREAADILNQQGIDTGQNRLKDFLNTGIAWTDHFGTPREIANEYLVLTDKANPTRDAVVRVTPLGVSELARVMKMAI